MGKKALLIFIGILFFYACNKEKQPEMVMEEEKIEEPKIIEEFGFVLNNYTVVKDTIENGESFGEILERHHIDYPQIYKIAEAAKDTFDIRRLRAGKPYTVLATKDSLQKAQIFIYQPNQIEYLIVDFTDSIQTKFGRKEVKIVEKEASGIIETSLSEAIGNQNLNYILAHEMSDIYAWTIDFFHLQKGDNFKLIYEEKFINDTIPVGVGNIKAAYFEHKGTPMYAFNFVTDSTKNVNDYYDENAKTLRRQFLKAPLKFSRISSRYNLKRRIRYYGNKVRAHRGTDFAAPVGTPIMSTANGTVVESRYKGGNGNYVKVKHNSVYSTQYLHMKKRAVKVGDFVKQGDVIGYVGMTGNTAGPHVCYRFWKNGKQVDPFRQKLPEADPIKEELKDQYFSSIAPLKEQIDRIPSSFVETAIAQETEETEPIQP
jgi:murein DD-endopeptidase MepM/ murein hydrolase activator NlpD